jgi:ribosome-binding factor A
MNKNSFQTFKRPISQRQLRVGEELRHVLAQIILRGELNDPDLRGLSVTVSEVRVSPDLSSATVFVTQLGGGNSDKIERALGRATPFLRRQIARRVHLRRVPNLSFERDTSFDYADRIDNILQGVNKENSLSEMVDTNQTEDHD